MTCGGTRRLIRRAFVEPVLPPPTVLRMWRHLRSCDGCRGHYDRVFELERLLTDDGPGSIRRPCARERRLSEPLALPPMKPRLIEIAPWLRWAPALAAAVVVLLGVFVTSDRGEVWLRRAGGVEPLTVRVFCATTDVAGGQLIVPVSEDPGPDETSGCTTTGTLLFAYTSDADGVLYVQLRTPGGVARWLTPPEQPLPLAATPVSAPLGIKLTGDQLLYPRIELLFVRAAAPLSLDRLDRVVESPDDPDSDNNLIIVRRTVPIEDVAE